MALTLGRPEGAGAGGDGLALFYVETRGEDGRLANIEVNRLKDKLGTRKVPTAELTLRGTPATLVRGTSGGVRDIAPMLNITRTWNAIQSVATMRRGIALARNYASRRVAFGEPLAKKALHLDTLAGAPGGVRGGIAAGLLRHRATRRGRGVRFSLVASSSTADPDRKTHDRQASGGR